jgi:hypothetical protein
LLDIARRVTPGQLRVSITNPVVVLNSLMVPFAQHAATIDASCLAKITDCTSERSKLTHSTLSLKDVFDTPPLALIRMGLTGTFQTFALLSLPQVAISCLPRIRNSEYSQNEES